MTRAYGSLTWAVAALLLVACAAVAAQENVAPREWQSLDVAGLAALANEPQAKGDTRSSTVVAAWVLSRRGDAWNRRLEQTEDARI